jgi:hypothetical protein
MKLKHVYNFVLNYYYYYYYICYRFIQGIYNYIPETNQISRVYNITAIL